MATVSTTLKKSKSNAKGEHPIYLRLADSGDKKTYFFTGFYGTEKNFDTKAGRYNQGKGIKAFEIERKEEGGAIKIYKNDAANNKLADLENRANTILQGYATSHINWGFEQFRDDFLNKPKRSLFLDYARDVIEREYRSLGHYKKADIAEDTFQSFLIYDKAFGKKTFQDINIKFLSGYIAYSEKKGNSAGTISIRLREIRRIFNMAIRDKLITQDLYPFSSGKEDGKIKIPKTEFSKTDQYLPIESMRIMAQTPLTDYILELVVDKCASNTYLMDDILNNLFLYDMITKKGWFVMDNNNLNENSFLANNPALNTMDLSQMEPIGQNNRMNENEKLKRQQYGLPETATEEEVMEAIRKSNEKLKRQQYGLPETATEEEVMEAIRKSNEKLKRQQYGLPETATEEEVMEAIRKSNEELKRQQYENSFLANNPALNTMDLPQMEPIGQNTDDNSIGGRHL